MRRQIKDFFLKFYDLFHRQVWRPHPGFPGFDPSAHPPALQFTPRVIGDGERVRRWLFIEQTRECGLFIRIQRGEKGLHGGRVVRLQVRGEDFSQKVRVRFIFEPLIPRFFQQPGS